MDGNNCEPRIIQVDESCGCTLSRASIRAFTEDDFETQGFKEVGMDRIIAQTKEARMTGVLEKSLTDLLLSRMAPVKPSNLTEDGSVIQPWSLVPQQHNVNANYFEIETGNVHPTAGAGGVPDSAQQVTIKQHSGPYSTDLPSLQNYFLVGNYVTIVYKDSGSGAGRTLQFKIIASANADAGGVHKAKLSIVPNKTDTGWALLSGGEQAIFQPTGGLLIPLTNSTSDYESFCAQHPAENTTKLLEFWWQTARQTFCYNDEYLKALNAPLTSEFFKKFRQLPLAKQKAREAFLSEREWYNTIFYGDIIDENQTQGTYTDLPAVTDPLDSGCTLEYKSNTVGIRPQLSNCGRVTDLAGAALDFDVVKAALYDLKRQREIDSSTSIDRLDCFTDRFSKSNILTMMIDFYKKKYGMETTRFYQVNQALKFDGNVVSDFMHDIYDFPDEGVQLCVYSDTYFDDYLAAMPSAHKSMGRSLRFIDWSDIIIGIGGTASVTRNHPDPTVDALYKCVIKANIHHYQLASKKFQVRVPRPNRHLIFENFSDACPSLTAAACTVAVS